jgi:nucleoside phosphorylase
MLKITPHAPILLCAATVFEAKACQNGINRTHSRSSFEVLQTGMGPEKCFQALHHRLKNLKKPSPQLILSTGFAGSLIEGLNRSTWISAYQCSSWKCSTWESSDELKVLQVNDELLKPYLTRTPLEWNPVQIHSVETLMTHKTTQRLPSSAQAVDMESFTIIETAQNYGIPAQVLRLISDTPNSPIPSSIEILMQGLTSATTVLKRVHSTLQGFKEMAQKPIETTRFLYQGIRLSQQLEKDWFLLAHALTKPSSTNS